MSRCQWMMIRPFLWLGMLLLNSIVVVAAPIVPPTLTILNWSEYIDPEIVKLFETQYQVNVSEVYFETDALRDSILADLSDEQGRGYDLVMCNGTALETYHHLGWLAEIPKQRLPHLNSIDPRWDQAFNYASTHGVPYFWGTLGIAYRSDLIKQPINSWVQLLKPDESLRGRIIMGKDPSELVGVALKAMGAPLNSQESAQLQEAEQLLQAQHPYVRAYTSLILGADSPLVSGEVWMAMSYSGDALMLQEYHEAIEYVLPKEGGAIWIDYLAVLASSPHKELAFQFLDFINTPEIAARNAQYVYYATPNRQAEGLLPQPFLDDPVIYPAAESLAGSEYFESASIKVLKQRNAIFARVID